MFIGYDYSDISKPWIRVLIAGAPRPPVRRMLLPHAPPCVVAFPFAAHMLTFARVAYAAPRLLAPASSQSPPSRPTPILLLSLCPLAAARVLATQRAASGAR